MPDRKETENRMNETAMALTVRDIEIRFGITLPPRFIAALGDTADPIHAKVLLLAPEGNECQSIFAINASLRRAEWKEWPDYLVAFATYEFGDYSAFDVRQAPYRIYAIDPTYTAPEAVAKCEQEGYVFENFDAWYQNTLAPRIA